MRLKNSILFILILSFLLMVTSCGNETEKAIDNIPDNLDNTCLDNRLKDFLTDLRQNRFEICKSNKCVNPSIKNMIYDYQRNWELDSLHSNSISDRFDNIYTFDYKKCNLSCLQLSNEPNRLVFYTINSDNYFGLSYQTGGLGTSNWFTVYKKKANKIVTHWTVNLKSESPGDLINHLINDNIQVYK